MAKRILGLVSIKIGNIATDGGMGNSLTAIGDTVADSCVFASEDATETEILIEENDDPIEIITQQGKKTLTWETYNLDGSMMAKLFGGTYTAAAAGPPAVAASWEAPEKFPIVEQSIEVIDSKGNKIEIVRAKLSPRLQADLKKTALGKIAIVATILTPTKANTKPFKITYA